MLVDVVSMSFHGAHISNDPFAIGFHRLADDLGYFRRLCHVVYCIVGDAEIVSIFTKGLGQGIEKFNVTQSTIFGCAACFHERFFAYIIACMDRSIKESQQGTCTRHIITYCSRAGVMHLLPGDCIMAHSMPVDRIENNLDKELSYTYHGRLNLGKQRQLSGMLLQIHIRYRQRDNQMSASI